MQEIKKGLDLNTIREQPGEEQTELDMSERHMHERMDSAFGSVNTFREKDESNLLFEEGFND